MSHYRAGRGRFPRPFHPSTDPIDYALIGIIVLVSALLGALFAVSP